MVDDEDDGGAMLKNTRRKWDEEKNIDFKRIQWMLNVTIWKEKRKKRNGKKTHSKINIRMQDNDDYTSSDTIVE